MCVLVYNIWTKEDEYTRCNAKKPEHHPDNGNEALFSVDVMPHGCHPHNCVQVYSYSEHKILSI